MARFSPLSLPFPIGQMKTPELLSFNFLFFFVPFSLQTAGPCGSLPSSLKLRRMPLPTLFICFSSRGFHLIFCALRLGPYFFVDPLLIAPVRSHFLFPNPSSRRPKIQPFSRKMFLCPWNIPLVPLFEARCLLTQSFALHLLNPLFLRYGNRPGDIPPRLGCPSSAGHGFTQPRLS